MKQNNFIYRPITHTHITTPNKLLGLLCCSFFSLGLSHSSSLRLSLLSLLTNTMPDPSASEVMTLRCYTNLFIVIIIIITDFSLS